MNKRFFLKTWLVPTIVSATLPAHAQTSMCAVSDVAGVWEFTSDGTQILTASGTVEREDQPGISEGVWSIYDGNKVSISYVGGDGGYSMTLNAACDQMVGVINSIEPNINGQPITATKK